ncbi:MAG TPA: AAA family ATPase, partial [Thermoanaerobaculia bacterium]|nr:AAA family ATPase [Thermoanaerobaculia bacterium]
TESAAASDAAQEIAGRARSGLEEAKARTEETERALARARSEETMAAQALVRAEGTEAAGRATLGSLEARVTAAMERRDVASRELTTASEAVTAGEREAASLERDLDTATEAAAAAETRLEGAREYADGLRARSSTLAAERAAAEARLGALEEVLRLFVDMPSVTAKIEPLVSDARGVAESCRASDEAVAESVRTADEAVEQRWAEVAACDTELRRVDALMAGATERLTAARRRLENKEIELATLDEELARTRDALAAAEREATEERAALPARRAAVAETTAARELAEAQLAEARRLANEAREAANSADLEARAVAERHLAAKLRVEEAEAGIADAHAALAGLETRRGELETRRRRASDVARTAAAAAERARGWARRAEENASSVRTEAQEADQRLVAMHSRERDLAAQLEEVSRKRNEAAVRRAETRTRAEAIAERAMDEWGLTEADLLKIPALPRGQEEESRAEVEQLDRNMRRLGAVNPHAAEEFAELAERETFLVSQMDDLRASKRDLMKIVTEVDETIVRVFSEAYEDVAREFESVFQRLFPGGSGSLKLTDPDNLLTTGIEIEARPPGKNVKKLSLLSGGERSLVALAFLFSIFRSRPSPFYLLDEVEAALDDINLHRFLALIEELEERAQVLIVTHQKRTMEAADVLYGVSISKEGVSRVVAKRMEDVTV